MSDLLGSGLAFPLAIDNRGGLALAHGEGDIEQAIRIILGTALGERLMRPEFGCAIHDLVFDTIDAELVGKIDSAVRVALDRWEPRIDVESVDFELSQMDEGVVEVDVAYRVRATSRRHSLIYPFYVIPAEEGE
jgi:phage baseplate assembly protein W